jgi:hypothetical protein
LLKNSLSADRRAWIPLVVITFSAAPMAPMRQRKKNAISGSDSSVSKGQACPGQLHGNYQNTGEEGVSSSYLKQKRFNDNAQNRV